MRRDLADMLARSGRAAIIGLALSALWLLMLVVFWLAAPAGGTGGAAWVSVIAALMPLALIWLAVGMARAVETMQAEADALRAQLSMLRRALPDSDIGERRPAASPPPREAGAPQAPVEAPHPEARPRAAKPAAPARAPETAQQTLGFDSPENVSLPAETVILALNFPDGPDDHEAIAARRETMRDESYARLLRSAQDVVSLLADRGLFMDELSPDPVDVPAWRRFADGQRGQAVAGVGAIAEPDTIERAAQALRGDDVFRDAVHHFLRLFDRSTSSLIPELDDRAVGWLAETRSARAFMLMGRAAGLFGQSR
ncbi:MAG: hypothetical protein Q4F71_04475 [Paracoccus sp. (in: a-proteobacteria)]|nr:hypothetical protein [Paracoccus sp. (in: a-proteobacteria)]